MGIAEIFQRRKEQADAARNQRAQYDSESKRITEESERRGRVAFHQDQEVQKKINEWMWSRNNEFPEPLTTQEIMSSDLFLEIVSVDLVDNGQRVPVPHLVAKEGGVVVWQKPLAIPDIRPWEQMVQQHNQAIGEKNKQ